MIIKMVMVDLSRRECEFQQLNGRAERTCDVQVLKIYPSSLHHIFQYDSVISIILVIANSSGMIALNSDDQRRDSGLYAVHEGSRSEQRFESRPDRTGIAGRGK